MARWIAEKGWSGRCPLSQGMGPQICFLDLGVMGMSARVRQ